MTTAKDVRRVDIEFAGSVPVICRNHNTFNIRRICGFLNNISWKSSLLRRTSIARILRHGTRCVRIVRLCVWTAFPAMMLFAKSFDVRAAEPGDTGSQQRLQAEGWLQLKQDQKAFREGVEPLQPRSGAALEQLEHGQRERFRALQLRQRQSLQRDRALRSGVDAQRPVSPPRAFKERRQFDRQRLEGRIQRETLRPGNP
jgi:hypothetical protein